MIPSFRTGIGYDVHRFAEKRPLILGGVTIPHSHGLLGHSDADVLVHAIMDALLGAGSQGDIGTLFPDTELQYRNISSLSLLQTVYSLLVEKEMSVVNIDSVILCQRPKVMKYADSMKKNISACLGNLSPDCIGIKATTTEGCGYIGREEAVAVQSSALIMRAGGQEKNI